MHNSLFVFINTSMSKFLENAFLDNLYFLMTEYLQVFNDLRHQVDNSTLVTYLHSMISTKNYV